MVPAWLPKGNCSTERNSGGSPSAANFHRVWSREPQFESQTVAAQPGGFIGEAQRLPDVRIAQIKMTRRQTPV
jgi:hypothetical protein